MKLSIRIEDELHARLQHYAGGANFSLSELIRRLLEEACSPETGRAFTANDELLGIAIQSYALLASYVSETSPEALKKGGAHARDMLAERGLLAPGGDL